MLTIKNTFRINRLLLATVFNLILVDLVLAQVQDTDVQGTRAQLEAFYRAQGGRSEFPDHYVRAIEAFLNAEDALAIEEEQQAKDIVDAVFDDLPFSSPVWRQNTTLFDLNVGDPIAYYGLRMLNQILSLKVPRNGQTLTMTAVLPLCADVRRPTQPDLEPETLKRNIDGRILANNANVLFQVTDLFRRWLSAISGANVILNIEVVEKCTTVDFQLSPTAIFSYPDTNSLLRNVPVEVAASTDIWWVVAPSGVPGDGRDFQRTFITGGMGVSETGAPVFLSDDAWFLRKPAHLGRGDYSDVERRTYLPQWFQHEFMHNLFRIFPEFGLEAMSHQWFQLSSWPNDFIGQFEPDYYAEALQKRLIAAQPSLYDRIIDRIPIIDFRNFALAKLSGKFERRPVENDFHEITINTNSSGQTIWTNKAGFSWQLITVGGDLRSSPDSIYGERRVLADLDENNNVIALFFLGEPYVRVDQPPQIEDRSEQCFVVMASNGSVINFCL